MKICVVGTGYVGLSLAVLFAQKYKVVALDILKDRIDCINNKKSPIKDNELEDYLINKPLKLESTINKDEAYSDADFVVIATPTNFDVKNNSFDTLSVETVIKDAISISNEASIIIKSTVPLGFTDRMRRRFNTSKIYFSPEFLREGKALYDSLFPSRIVIGGFSKEAKIFANMLLDCSKVENNSVNIHYMSPKESEAVKLFSNAYLANRIAFFNELDTFSEANELSSKRIISAVSDDSRIGNYYNNPSFGYGGYCLPKDTKQLLKNFKNIPSNLIKATIDSNQARKKFITNSIIKRNPRTVGIYRLTMKSNSDNFRESAVTDIIYLLQKENINVILYEPLLKESIFANVNLFDDLNNFASSSDIIIANRISVELEQFIDKVYSRDLFRDN